MEVVIKNHLKSLQLLLYIIIALTISSQCEQVQGTRKPRLRYDTSSSGSSPNLVNSPTPVFWHSKIGPDLANSRRRKILTQESWIKFFSLRSNPIPNIQAKPMLPPYKDVIGPSTPTPINPPNCVYPPPPNFGPNPPPPVPNPPSAVSPNPPLNVPTPPPNVPSPPTLVPPVVFPPPPPPPTPTGTLPGLWCVARPTVADVIVQVALDYACGSGADCDMILPDGPCYLPDTVMAHASFAFNSYWQRTKVAGGTCDFGGAAMLVTKDPSYDDCRYIYL